jgi:hypothetical protein
MLTKISIKLQTMGVALVGLVFAGCQDQLEVRTFELERIDAAEAEALISPYVYSDRDGAPGATSHAEGVLTVREMPENLERIEEVLARYDTEPADVQFRFQLVEANGFESVDDGIAEVESELRKLLRYTGYRMAAEAALNVREGHWAHQTIDRPFSVEGEDEPPFDLNVEVTRVVGSGDDLSVDLSVQLQHEWYGSLLETRVNVGNGKSMVLGTTSTGRGGAEALILVVTPTIVIP